MSSFEFQKVSHHFDRSGGVGDISFSGSRASTTAIVGASGSGKSTLLNLLAGFLQPQSGSILINEQIIATPSRCNPPQNRDIGLVFQNHALLPHLNVRENIAFGVKKGDKADINAILRDLRIAHLDQKFPHEISGGESQRVSLARAMASNPKIFLMDEPFASIDSVFRRELRHDIMRVLRAKGQTTLIVTHDAEEAMELADQIVVLDQGRVLQLGTPHQVYYHPINEQVAELFGEINHIMDPELAKTLTGIPSPDLLLRPESLAVGESSEAISGRIIHIAYRGNYDMLSVVIAGQRCLKVKAFHHNHNVGDQVNLCAVSR